MFEVVFIFFFHKIRLLQRIHISGYILNRFPHNEHSTNHDLDQEPGQYQNFRGFLRILPVAALVDKLLPLK